MRRILAVAVFAVACSSAQAQSPDSAIVERLKRDSLQALLGTISVEAQPNFRGGQLVGCMVGFSVLAKDRIYKQGAYILVSGGFGVAAVNGAIGTILRVTLNDVDPRTMALTPSMPASAYFVKGNTTTKNAVVGSDPSDVPGTIFVVSHLDPTFAIIGEGLAQGKVTIAFARNKGGADIGLVIDTSVVDTAADGQRTRAPKAAQDFFNCAQTLMDQASK